MKKPGVQVDGKENAVSPKENGPNDENSPPADDILHNKNLEEAAQQFNNSRSRVQYEDEEDSDSEEDEATEQENARNRLKALLGGNRKAKKTEEPPKLRKALSNDENTNEDNFVNIIHKMKRDLFNKLEITDPEEDDMEVSKIFYEGREGQEYTVKVLEKFFDNLTSHAENFADKINEKAPQKAREDDKVF